MLDGIDRSWSEWRLATLPVGTKVFTIRSNTKISHIDIFSLRRKYSPGWRIVENGVTIVRETTNGGTNTWPEVVENNCLVVYEFAIAAANAHETEGVEVTGIKLDGEWATDSQVSVNVYPDHATCGPANGPCSGMGLYDGNEDAWRGGWRKGTLPVGTIVFTVSTNRKVTQIDIFHSTPARAPGWQIRENGVQVFQDSGNRGGALEPAPARYSYVLRYHYEFIVAVTNGHSSHGLIANYIKLDGKLLDKNQLQVHVDPDLPCACESGGCACSELGLYDDDLQSYTRWELPTDATRKVFTITSTQKVSRVEIGYVRICYAPGWLIKENGVEVLRETANRGTALTMYPVYTYDLNS